MEAARSCKEPVEVSAQKVPRVTFVPIENLSTGLQRLRLGRMPERPGQETLGELPLRVTPGAGDAFEVIDGFKRLVTRVNHCQEPAN